MDYYNTSGYVFQPSVNKILTEFLPKRLADEPIGSPPQLYDHLVKEIDLYDSNMEPSQIFLDKDGQDHTKDKDLYFFTRVKPLSNKAGGKRSRRTAGRGTWRGERPEEIGAMITDCNGNVVEEIIGTKRLFKYIVAKEKEETNNSNVVVSWIMHEYQLNFDFDNPLLSKAKPENRDIVFCRVRKSVKFNNVVSKRAISWVSDYDQDVNVANKRVVSSGYGDYDQDVNVANKRVVSSGYGDYDQDKNEATQGSLCWSKDSNNEQEDVRNQQVINNNVNTCWSNGFDQGGVSNQQFSSNNASNVEDKWLEDGQESISQFLNDLQFDETMVNMSLLDPTLVDEDGQQNYWFGQSDQLLELNDYNLGDDNQWSWDSMLISGQDHGVVHN